jgi:DNA-binding NarL/FixJ family response regulator
MHEAPANSKEAVEEPIRVVVADDDPLARRMVKQALQRAGLLVIAEAHDGREAVDLALHYRPDIVLMDVVMPQLDGLSATRRILQMDPGQTIVMLTSGDDDDVGLISLQAGAVGFLSKEVDVDVIPRTLRSALQGEAAISRRMSMKLIDRLQATPQGSGGLRPVKSPLTVREWEVIDLLAEGRTTDQIAEQLVLSSETVRSHVKNILRKLNVNSRLEAVEEARRMRGELPRF